MMTGARDVLQAHRSAQFGDECAVRDLAVVAKGAPGRAGKRPTSDA
jgi:hypothetical protein